MNLETANRPRGIPSLDGLRAISVLTVVLGHTHSALLDKVPYFSVFRDGEQGVEVFFVISGFLITHLLLKELNSAGTINLKRFYLRRTFRIFPPFYTFLAVAALLGFLHKLPVTTSSLLFAASYTWNTVPHNGGWILGHCWSLALEEQFYLLWPLCMSRFGREISLKVTAFIIVLSPPLRLITYFLLPSTRAIIGMMLPTHADTIMAGCLLALLIDTRTGEKTKVGLWAIKFSMTPLSPFLAILFLAFVDHPLNQRFRGVYALPLGVSLENLAIVAIVAYTVFRHQSILGKVLNGKAISHIGMISYSIYLWQQMFTGDYTRSFPLNLLIIFACAELSYLLVERPSFWVRARAEEKLRLGTSHGSLRPVAG